MTNKPVWSALPGWLPGTTTNMLLRPTNEVRREDMTTMNYAFRVSDPDGKPVFSVACDGRVFWRDREVETDDDLRASLQEGMAVLLAMAEGALDCSIKATSPARAAGPAAP